MSWQRSALCCLALLGCSNLNDIGSGIVAIELRLPSNPLPLEPDDTVQLRARALNGDGDSVAAEIVWVGLDTTVVVDSSGRLSTPLTSGSGRVQARVGSLRSELVAVSIRRRSDTLSLTPPLSVSVPTGDTASAPLVASVLSLTPDTAGIAGSSILYQVVDGTLQGKVRFAGGGLSIRAVTTTTGAPTIPVTLRRVPGMTPAGPIQVQVSASRPSEAPVPGSGQIFTLTFE